MIGQVRLVPIGHPMLPPRAPDDQWCDERIEVEDLPMMQHGPNTIAYFCTRYPHPASEVHVSEPDLEVDQHVRLDWHVIVWGGE